MLGVGCWVGPILSSLGPAEPLGAGRPDAHRPLLKYTYWILSPYLEVMDSLSSGSSLDTAMELQVTQQTRKQSNTPLVYTHSDADKRNKQIHRHTQ